MTRIEGDWLRHPGTLAVLDMLEQAGHRAFFVGGCVRDALAGRTVSDIDISTDAHPEAVLSLAEARSMKAVPTGVDHGTVTVVAEHVAHEITTFRRDVETDGRRAVVAFSTTVEDDAMRRDFTMNALYAGRDGRVLDPVGAGISDLAAGHVRFIGDAETRIREDYLRILRFFRFHAGYGRPDAGLDLDALAAIGANISGLDTLPGERLGHEMRKLLGAADPAPAVAAMGHSGVLAHVLPGATAEYLAPLVALEEAADLAPSALRRLAVIGGDEPETRLRLSRDETRGLALRRHLLAADTPIYEIAYRHGAGAAEDVALLRAARTGAPLPEGALSDVRDGAGARCPVTASDLMPALHGPDLGRRLKALEDRWIASRFTLTRDALLGD